MVTGTIHFYLGATRIAQLIQTRGLSLGRATHDGVVKDAFYEVSHLRGGSLLPIVTLTKD
jgi:hypothetical protein